MPEYRFTLTTGDKVEAEAPMSLDELTNYIGQPDKDCPMVIQTPTKAFVMSAVVMVEDMAAISELEAQLWLELNQFTTSSD